MKLAANEKEELLLELFPAVAKPFLKTKREKDFRAEQQKVQDKLDEERGKLISALEGNFLE